MHGGYGSVRHMARSCHQGAMSGEGPGVWEPRRRLGTRQPQVSGEVSNKHDISCCTVVPHMRTWLFLSSVFLCYAFPSFSPVFVPFFLRVFLIPFLFSFFLLLSRSRGSSVNILTGPRQDERSLNPNRGRDFSLRHCIQTGSEVHLSLLSNRYRRLFSRG